ncbi:YrhC family protein [Halobacillus litoralis]|uniref:YrhC family protein n=1 Tax=Halobacillus litoralis TaxID=45668 RepID=UPI001CD42296|nr:YrhC family protein [Halobacillus litoralis]MCA0969996.1 YrhC family protein [Halobacillus litoralis]
MNSNEWMKKKILDYKRFVMTLLILSSYLYIGTLISIYEYHADYHLYLLPLLTLTLPAAFVLTLKTKRWQRALSEDQ